MKHAGRHFYTKTGRESRPGRMPSCGIRALRRCSNDKGVTEAREPRPVTARGGLENPC